MAREAPHIHVKGGGRDAKVWLEPEPVIAEPGTWRERARAAQHRERCREIAELKV